MKKNKLLLFILPLVCVACQGNGQANIQKKNTLPQYTSVSSIIVESIDSLVVISSDNVEVKNISSNVKKERRGSEITLVGSDNSSGQTSVNITNKTHGGGQSVSISGVKGRSHITVTQTNGEAEVISNVQEGSDNHIIINGKEYKSTVKKRNCTFAVIALPQNCFLSLVNVKKVATQTSVKIAKLTVDVSGQITTKLTGNLSAETTTLSTSGQSSLIWCVDSKDVSIEATGQSNVIAQGKSHNLDITGTNQASIVNLITTESLQKHLSDQATIE